MKNVFHPQVVEQLVARINLLTPETTPRWGIMRVDQMMAHCSVAYDMVYDENYPQPNWFMRFILKTFIKKKVTDESPYPRNGRTAPNFVIMERRDFKEEKKKLIEYLEKSRDLGISYFEGRKSPSFGKMTAQEWNGLFYKHLDHHLTQFGV
jgi:hypothetical protein